jgi:hypothetical protein
MGMGIHGGLLSFLGGEMRDAHNLRADVTPVKAENQPP